MTRRYASGTTTSVESSRGEITGILAKHGVLRMAWASEPAGDTLMFELGGRNYRFEIPHPQSLADQDDGWYNPNGMRTRAEQAQAEWRRRWRARVLLIKAKLEFAESDGTSVAQELLPYLVMRDGQTLGQWVESPNGVKLIGGGS